jgi:hypothetical protein
MSASKAEFVVFYAWQSDRPGSRNRHFIQEAAIGAAAKLNADPASPYTLLSAGRRRDFRGVLGAVNR